MDSLTKQRIYKGIVCCSGLFYLGVLILGIFMNSNWIFSYWLYYGFVGIICCIFGFFGSHYNTNKKKTYLCCLIFFLITQAFFNTLLFCIGIYATFDGELIGLYFVFFALGLVLTIFMSILITGFAQFVKIFVGVYSFLEILGSIVLAFLLFSVLFAFAFGLFGSVSFAIVLFMAFIVIRAIFGFFQKMCCRITYVVMTGVLVVIICFCVKAFMDEGIFMVPILVFCIIRLVATAVLIVVVSYMEKAARNTNTSALPAAGAAAAAAENPADGPLPLPLHRPDQAYTHLQYAPPDYNRLQQQEPLLYQHHQPQQQEQQQQQGDPRYHPMYSYIPQQFQPPPPPPLVSYPAAANQLPSYVYSNQPPQYLTQAYVAGPGEGGEAAGQSQEPQLLQQQPYAYAQGRTPTLPPPLVMPQQLEMQPVGGMEVQ